jgi:hypothetical protein
MNRNIRFLWIVAAIVILAGCKKEYNPRPSDAGSITGNTFDMMVNNDTVTMLAHLLHHKIDTIFIDIDKDGTYDLGLIGSQWTTHGGTNGGNYFWLSTVNPDFRLLGYIDQDTTWYSKKKDTNYHPDYVAYITNHYYTCIWSSPLQTIYAVEQNVLKPHLYSFGDNLNPMEGRFNGTVTLYRRHYIYGSGYSGPVNGILRLDMYLHANNCSNIPFDTEVYIRFVKTEVNSEERHGWVKLLLTQEGNRMQIIEQAIAYPIVL